MQKYLVTEQIEVYGSKGDNDSGETSKYISESPIFGIIKSGDTFFGRHCSIDEYEQSEIDLYEITKENYKEEMEEYVDEDSHIRGEDGYSVFTTTYYFQPVTEEQAIHAQYIINEYDKL